jgi:hypothetical protein
MHKKGWKEGSKNQRKNERREEESQIASLPSVLVGNLFGSEVIIFVNAVLKHGCVLIALELLEQST